MENVRLLLFAALGGVLLLLWSAWQQEFAPSPPSPGATSSASPAESANIEADTSSGEVTRDGARTETSEHQKGQKIHVLTDLLDVHINTVGASLSSARLRVYDQSLGSKQSYSLLQSKSPLFVGESGLVAKDAEAPDAGALWQATQPGPYRLAEGENELVVPLTWHGANGVTITRRYIFNRDSYVVRLEQDVRNESKVPYKAYQFVQLRREHSDEGGRSFLIGSRNYVGGGIYSPKDHYEKIGFDDMRETPLSRDISNGWAAFIQHYFVAAWVPPRETTERYYSRVTDSQYILGMSSPWQTVAPGGDATFSNRLFIGPKDQDRLAAVAKGLELSVDYGWLTVLSKPLFVALSWIHGVVGNWGWAIIILTLCIKAVFYKLSETSYRSMARMRKLQPRMQQLKERFGDDRQGMNQELMKLYKEEKVNPLGGCLPIVIQIPVFIALYWMLLGTVELRQAPWILWIHDLSTRDPYYVLPLIMGATMLVQQRLNPAPMDPIQKRVMTFLPLVFTVFFLFFPAGLVLYWITNNSLSILQQWVITRRMERQDAERRAS